MFVKKILKKERISHNTFMITLENKEDIYDTQTCFFINIYDKDNIRSKPYTPIKSDENELVFLIKYYNTKGVADYICSREVGEELFISEPKYKISFNNHFGKNILMLAGGTGITPMIQFINSSTGLNFVIIFSSSTIKDIILDKDILGNKNNVTIYHIVSQKSEDFECKEIKTSLDNESISKKLFSDNIIYGRVSFDIIRKITESTKINKFDFVCCCGPKEYMEDICGSKAEDKSQGELSGILKDLDYSEEEVYKF